MPDIGVFSTRVQGTQGTLGGLCFGLIFKFNSSQRENEFSILL